METKPPQPTCAICADPFVPKIATNRYGGQKLCGKPECKKRYAKQQYLRHIAYYRGYQQKQKDERKQQRHVSPRLESSSRAPSGFFRCPQCAYQCLERERVCVRCKSPINRELVSARQIRDAAAPPVKDPNGKFLFDDKGTVEELDRKISAYLKRRRTRGGGVKRWLHGC